MVNCHGSTIAVFPENTPEYSRNLIEYILLESIKRIATYSLLRNSICLSTNAAENKKVSEWL